MINPVAGPTRIDTVVVGASAAGLAVSACLERSSRSYVLLEQSDRVAPAWRRHYDRLHLHTSKGLSGLPFLPMPRSYPRYPSRQQVVEYLDRYASEMGLEPVFDTRVTSVTRSDGVWLTSAESESWLSDRVVIATGCTRRAFVPDWLDRERFRGSVLHSSAYKNATPFGGQRLLVVGFGNSGGEIALDLAESNIDTTLSIRSAVNVVPRDLFGIPILAWGIVLGLLPMRWADRVAAPLLRVSVGDIRRFGLERLPYGPNTQIRKFGKIPLLDIGTLAAIRQGRIGVRTGIERFTPKGVVFADGVEEPYDAVVAATGYRPALTDFLDSVDGVLDDRGVPLVSGGPTAAPGLFFCGFQVVPTGMLREIGIEARRISAHLQQAG